MRFDIITIFPKIFSAKDGSASGGGSCGYFDYSIIKRARKCGLVDIYVHDLRAFTKDKHRKVDEKPYGGGPGMVFKIDPLVKAIDSILKVKKLKSLKTKIILFSAVGRQFDSKMSREWAQKYDRIIMVAGHYEGVDDRIFRVLRFIGYKLQAISVGPYVLTGGEIPAMVVVDAIARHIPGVLGKNESLEELRHGIGVPVFTRPEEFMWKGRNYRVPKVLLSGDHKKILQWRESELKKRRK